MERGGGGGEGGGSSARTGSSTTTHTHTHTCTRTRGRKHTLDRAKDLEKLARACQNVSSWTCPQGKAGRQTDSEQLKRGRNGQQHTGTLPCRPAAALLWSTDIGWEGGEGVGGESKKGERAGERERGSIFQQDQYREPCRLLTRQRSSIILVYLGGFRQFYMLPH